MSHLDAATWAALQRAPDDVLLAHVAAGCDQCDAYLASLAEVEGGVDLSLLHVAPPRVGHDELAWARFKKRSAQRPAVRRLALAAAVLLVGVVSTSLALRAAPFDGLKGDGPPSIVLRAATRDGNGEVIAVDPGRSLPEQRTLVFRVESTIAGRGLLFVQRGSNAPQFVARVQLTGGTQELERPDGLLGLTLEGERGSVVVWLVASEEDELSTEQALAAIRGGGNRSIAVSQFRVDVTP